MNQTQQMSATPRRGLLDSWQPPPGHYDELRSLDGSVQPHWAHLAGQLDALGREELAARWENGQSILRDHGVTYNATELAGESERPWELDLLPFVMGADEWKRIEAGVVQRAQLLNRILNDIYVGPQLLLRDGFLPPGLVMPNPNFLRACRGVRVPGDVYLHLCSFDLARLSDGQWRVLSSRTQAPSGLGYALENRTIIGRVLPQEFHNCGVRRFGDFFARLRQTLVNLAPSPTAWPRMVFLTPGVHSTAYYEHSLLARFLGITLVEAGDLTVRDRRVFLKTLEGLQRVDVIVRRINDALCDSLELAGESTVGIPGLVEAVRAGNVLVANGLGSGLVEAAALIPQLPTLCRHLMGEDLLLPSVDTFWCGEGGDLSRVLQNLHGMVIKDAYADGAFRTVSGGELNEAALQRLGRRITDRPHTFVGQPRLPLSQVPVLTDRGVVALPIVLRVYAAAHGNSFVVLPGGLAKVSWSPGAVVSGLQVGGGSKDTWILDEPGNVGARIAPIELESRPAQRISSGVPSRLADNLFWLGRYSERLEYLLRLSRAVVGRQLDTASQRSRDERRALCSLVGALQRDAFLTVKPPTENTVGEAVLDLLYNKDIQGGVGDLLRRMHSLVSLVRDRFSGDAWFVLSRLSNHPNVRGTRLPYTVAQAATGEMLTDLAALSGLEMENMTRGIDWRFLDFGRRLERAERISGMLRVGLAVSRSEPAILSPVLEIADSGMTYRRRYFAEPEVDSMLELLLFDSSNPRAVAFQLDSMRAHVNEFPRPGHSGDELPEKLLLEQIIADLVECPVQRLTATRDKGDTTVNEFFDRIGERLLSISKALTQRYINLTPPELYER